MDFTQIMQWWNNLSQDQKEQCYFYMNGKKVAQTPFDKLKELWDNWQKSETFSHNTFEVYLGAQVFYDMSVLVNPKVVHKHIAEYCGFPTTAEVRRAIQYLKNR